MQATMIGAGFENTESASSTSRIPNTMSKVNAPIATRSGGNHSLTNAANTDDKEKGDDEKLLHDLGIRQGDGLWTTFSIEQAISSSAPQPSNHSPMHPQRSTEIRYSLFEIRYSHSSSTTTQLIHTSWQTLAIALAALVLYLVAYHTYGRFLARKIFKLDPQATVPSVELQ